MNRDRLSQKFPTRHDTITKNRLAKKKPRLTNRGKLLIQEKSMLMQNAKTT